MKPMTVFANDVVGSSRLQLWLGFLIVSAVGASYILACATPFAALAATAALTLQRNNALIFILAAWLANQLVGYMILGYPQNAYSFGWGIVIGLAALVSYVAARGALVYFPADDEGEESEGSTGMIMAFGAAFISNQLFMFLAALTPLGGLDGFTINVIGQILITNMVAMAIIYVLNLLAERKGLLPSSNSVRI